MRSAIGGLAALALVSGAQAQDLDAVCAPLAAEGYAAHLRCIRDINRAPFVREYPASGYSYDQHYLRLIQLGERADREHWPSEKFLAEGARLNAQFIVMMQEVDARRQAAAARDQEKKEAAARLRRRLGEALAIYGASRQRPQGVTTICQTLYGGITSCRTQ